MLLVLKSLGSSSTIIKLVYLLESILSFIMDTIFQIAWYECSKLRGLCHPSFGLLMLCLITSHIL